MNSLFPFLGAVFQSAAYTLDKAVLTFKNISYRTYLGVSFPLLVLFEYVIFLVFRPSFSFESFTSSVLLVLLGSVLLSIGTNSLYYRALENESLSEMQTLGLVGRLPAILFAILAFPEERSFAIVALALVSSAFVAWSHWENNKFEIKRDTLIFFIWFLFIVPFSAILSKILLGVLNPIVLVLFQDGCVALALSTLYFKDSLKISRKSIPLILLTNLFSSAGWILYFFSIQKTGIIYTVLLFSLQPLLTYFASVVFLKEGLNRKKVLAFLIVLAAVGIAQILKPI